MRNGSTARAQDIYSMKNQINSINRWTDRDVLCDSIIEPGANASSRNEQQQSNRCLHPRRGGAW